MGLRVTDILRAIDVSREIHSVALSRGEARLRLVSFNNLI